MKKHPSYVRALARAKASRSEAKTLAGLLAFVRRNALTRSVFDQPLINLFYAGPAYRKNPRQFTALERSTRRAAKDAAYRKQLAKQLAPVRVRSIAAVDAYVAQHESRKNAALALGKPDAALFLPANARKIPASESTAETLGVKVCRRGKDYSVKATATTTRQHHCPGETTWKNGRAVSYSRAENITYVRSIGLVKNPQTLVADLNGRKITVTLPEGIKWDIDANGLRAVRGRDDYHIDADDLLTADPLAQIILFLDKNAALRRETELRQAAEQAENEGVYVCLADSLRAGNCRAGSESFASRHHLDTRKHYPALELLKQANGDGQRVKLAITAAKLRHSREMAQGFALLAEHQMSA